MFGWALQTPSRCHCSLFFLEDAAARSPSIPIECLPTEQIAADQRFALRVFGELTLCSFDGTILAVEKSSLMYDDIPEVPGSVPPSLVVLSQSFPSRRFFLSHFRFLEFQSNVPGPSLFYCATWQSC